MTGTYYDLVLRGGRVIDPSRARRRARRGRPGRSGRGGGAGAPSRRAREVIDARGQIVLPGLIDTHAHVYQYVTGRFGLEADMVGVHSGTTTVVDQGGPSCMTLPGFRKFVAEPAATRVYAFLSAYLVGGLEGHYYPALYGPDGVDVPATIRARPGERGPGSRHQGPRRDRRRGALGARRSCASAPRSPARPTSRSTSTSASSGRCPSRAADDADPDTILAARRRDPPAGRHPRASLHSPSRAASSTAAGHVHPVVREALARGLRIDVGHGSHFSFDVARRVLDAGIVPDTLGADLHGYNTRGPAAGRARRPAPTPTPSSTPSPGARASASRAR